MWGHNIRPYKGNLSKEGVTLTDVEAAKETMLKRLDEAGYGIAKAVEARAHVTNLRSIMRGRAAEATAHNVTELVESVASNTAGYVENFGEAHDSVYWEMGRTVRSDGDSERGWKIVNETVMGLYQREMRIVKAAMDKVRRAKSVDEIDGEWQDMQDKTSGIIGRLHVIDVVLGESSMRRVEMYGASEHFARAVENIYNPSWVAKERRRTMDHLDEADSFARSAEQIENPEKRPSVYADIGMHYEAAATSAARASASFMHSNVRASARHRVIDYYVKSVNNFVEAGEMERARSNLEIAIDVSATTLHKKRTPKELVALKERLDAL